MLSDYDTILNSHAFVVSLKRHEHRYFHTKKLLNLAGFNKLSPFEAYDAVQASKSNIEWEQRFKPLCDMFGFTKNINGQIGCMLSTLSLWSWLLISNKPGMMVFEDDALPRPDFAEVFPVYWNNIEESDVDMVYVGGQLGPVVIEKNTSDNGYYVQSAALCTHAYYITHAGAKKVLNLMPHISKYRAITNTFQPIDGLLVAIDNRVKLQREFEKHNIDVEIPQFKCISLLGNKIPVRGDFQGTPWKNRDLGLIHQNADLETTIHG